MLHDVFYHHEHSHSHAHSHEHLHDHDHGHSHSHDCAHDCGTCGGCDAMAETLALMDYMVKHNTAHAKELEELAKKLGELGNESAAHQVMAAVSEFEKGNLRLAAVLASLK